MNPSKNVNMAKKAMEILARHALIMKMCFSTDKNTKPGDTLERLRTSYLRKEESDALVDLKSSDIANQRWPEM